MVQPQGALELAIVLLERQRSLPRRTGFTIVSALVSGPDSDHPSPNEGSAGRRHRGPRRGVRQDVADRPLHVVAKAATELGVVRKSGVVSGLDEAGHESDPKLLVCFLAGVDAEHR